MNMQEIISYIEAQKNKNINFIEKSIENNVPIEDIAQAVEDDFFSCNDIVDKSDNFDKGVDCDKVRELRAEAFFDLRNQYFS